MAGAYIVISGRIGYANRKFAELLGYASARDLSQGQEIASFVAASDREAVRAHFHGLAREPGRSRSLQITAFRRDGSRCTLELRSSVPDRTHPDIVCGTCISLGERPVLSRELWLRDRFLAVATHELKTPLSCLHSLLELLKNHPEKDGRKLILMAHAESARMLRLAQDLLDVSRLHTGQLVLRRENMDFAAVARDCVERLEPQLQAAGCEIQLQCEGLIEGRWDPVRVEEVFLNLLSNAIKYGAGAPIELELGQRFVLGRGPQVQGRIRDHGPGIAAEDLPRVFEPFERAARANDQLGHGLGLYIVRQILRAHGGEIQVYSQLGAGAEFRFELPF